jgi:hypothetical protein
MRYIRNPNPAIAFAGFRSIYLGLLHHCRFAEYFCINRPFFGRIFELLADPLMDPASQDYALRILQLCLERDPTCHQFLIWDNVDLIVSILPTAAAADLLAVLIRVLPHTIEYLSLVNFPSDLLTLLTQVCGFPAAQAPLLKLVALTHEYLPFSDDDWAAFFLAMEAVEGGQRKRAFGMLRLAIGDEEAAAWPELADAPLGWLRLAEGPELLQSLAAIGDCRASARASALLRQFGDETD